jgi:nucleoside-diphosphate-sugar epimerase
LRVLVTGAAGFIGSHVAEALLAAGHEVVGVDAFIPYYPRELKERNLQAAMAHPGFSFHQLDLRTDALDAALEGVNIVVNEAAMPGLPRSWTDFPAYVSCNLLALERLLDAAERAGVNRLVHASTSSVYGSDAVGDETMPTRPISPYGITKLAAEHLVLANMQRVGLPSVILRYFSIYGPRQRPDMAYNIFIEAMRTGRPITVYGDGRQSRSSTYVSDCVAGTIGALERGKAGETYNIGGGETITLLDALSVIARAMDASPRIVHEAPRPGDQRHTAADTRRAREAFGYAPAVPPAMGLPLQVAAQLAAADRG